jgi:hypothetical protein
MMPGLAAAVAFALAPKPAGGVTRQARHEELAFLRQLAEEYRGQPAGVFAQKVSQAWTRDVIGEELWEL